MIVPNLVTNNTGEDMLRKIVNATLYVLLAVILVAIGYCIAGAVGELNVRYVPYVEVEHGDDSVKLLPMEPIEVKIQHA